MESLARLVIIIFLTIIGAGVIAYFLGRRKPKGAFSKLIGVVFGGFALVTGGWLALLPIGIVARLIGLVVAIAGVRLLLKIFKRSK